MIKVNVVSYVDAFKLGPKGGGEMINEALIKRLMSFENVDLKYYALYSKRYHRYFGSQYKISSLHNLPDLNILIDIYNIPKFPNRIDKKLLSRIMSQNYIHLDNSYVDVCSRNFLPCNGSFGCTQCDVLDRLPLYKNSKMNFFLSPMHRDTVLKLLNGGNIPAEILPPFIDLENIPLNNKFNKDIEYLYVGTISEYKGYNELLEKYGHLGDDFWFIGPKDPTIKLFSKNHIDWASRKEVFTYMLRAKRFVHLPLWKEPMGRTVLEAALCGCEIIGNSNVGALSFDFDISKREYFKNSLDRAVASLLKYA
jgi:glycosyltransferase involved in cell wall biosynthesis